MTVEYRIRSRAWDNIADYLSEFGMDEPKWFTRRDPSIDVERMVLLAKVAQWYELDVDTLVEEASPSQPIWLEFWSANGAIVDGWQPELADFKAWILKQPHTNGFYRYNTTTHVGYRRRSLRNPWVEVYSGKV